MKNAIFRLLFKIFFEGPKVYVPRTLSGRAIDANLLVLFSLSYSENVRLNTREFLEEST